MVNDKHSILEALIPSNNNVWGEFHMHPLKTNMRLATAAAARARGGLLSQEEEEQLRYADMLKQKLQLTLVSGHTRGG